MNGVRWVRLRSVRDGRGSLTAVEGDADAPFEIKRAFFMHDVATGTGRGGHAHRDTDQLAVAVHGSLRLLLSDGTDAISLALDSPEWAVILPRMTWTRLHDFSTGAVCLVLASTHYDMSKSVRSWSEYLDARGLAPRAEPDTAPDFGHPES